MALKPTIFRGVLAEAVQSRVIPEFRSAIDVSRLENGRRYPVINSPGIRTSTTSIADSKSLQKVLTDTDPCEVLIVVSHDFTAEAFDLVARLGGIAFSLRQFYWTDESLARIRET